MSVSDAELKRAIQTVARVIDLYGDAYWPIFDRLERELEERRDRKARLSQYLSQPRHKDRSESGANLVRKSPPETDARSS